MKTFNEIWDGTKKVGAKDWLGFICHPIKTIRLAKFGAVILGTAIASGKCKKPKEFK